MKKAKNYTSMLFIFGGDASVFNLPIIVTGLTGDLIDNYL
jgi:hypothetical protein